MNLKKITFSALALFFFMKINAQIPFAPVNNTIAITLSVEDSTEVQKFELYSEEEHSIVPNRDIAFKIKLEYQSDEEVVSYFGIQYKISRLSFNGITGAILRGLTVPVIIPPVRKKKPSISASNDGTAIRTAGFPFTIDSEYTAEGSNYTVLLILVKYESRDDYLNQTDNFSEIHAINFDLLLLNDVLVTENTSTSSAIAAYPNPSTDYVTLEYVNTATKNAPSQQIPLEVIIFNDKGKTMSNHSLTNLGKKNNKTSYNLNTTHLPKGMYFFQIKHGKETTVKTIIKK